MDALKMLGTKLGAAVLALAMSTTAIADTITYFHNDISGSPLAATDSAGNLLWKENYKPYGEKLSKSAASVGNKIGFHGKAYDDGTGLSYMGARYYDPVLGRFMGVDPVGVDPNNLHSFNRYAYTNNNPYKFVDPDGREAISTDSRNNKSIASMINALTTKTFTFNHDNKLEVTNAPTRAGSAYYTSRLEQAIESKNVAYIRLGDTVHDHTQGADVNVSDFGGAATTSYPDGSSHLITIGSNITDSQAEGGGFTQSTQGTALMHELVGHAIPRMVGSDTGNAVQNENKTRNQINNMPLRAAQFNHRE